MLPKHESTGTMRLLKRQKYYFDPAGQDPAGQDGWGKALTALFPEPRFHDVIEAHGVEGYVGEDWRIRFKVVDDVPVTDGPRYSRLNKALWDAFGPTFDDYEVRLMNNYTKQPVAIDPQP